jgi:DsbC/DsbD-like thiol-disulfide interchange protein
MEPRESKTIREAFSFDRIGIVRILLPAAAAAALTVGLAGQTPTPPTGPAETLHLTMTPSIGPGVVKAGGKVSLFVDIAPKPTMHVYAPEEKEGIPVRLTLDPGDAFKPSAPLFPPPQKYFFAPLKLTQLVYSKPFRITQPIVLTRAAGAGPLTITGSLRYQACDDAVCYLPKSVPVAWVLK